MSRDDDKDKEEEEDVEDDGDDGDDDDGDDDGDNDIDDATIIEDAEIGSAICVATVATRWEAAQWYEQWHRSGHQKSLCLLIYLLPRVNFKIMSKKILKKFLSKRYSGSNFIFLFINEPA